MLRTASFRLSNLLLRNSKNEVCKVAQQSICCSANFNTSTANNAASLRGSMPKVSWKMPPSLVDHLMPRYESPPYLNPLSSIVNLPSLQLPKTSPGMDQPSKQAARLIVIRRGKMKKHKRRKLLKRMRFEWTRLRMKREAKKEKEFQQELIDKVDKAKSFDAEAFIREKLEKLKVGAKI